MEEVEIARLLSQDLSRGTEGFRDALLRYVLAFVAGPEGSREAEGELACPEAESDSALLAMSAGFGAVPLRAKG